VLDTLVKWILHSCQERKLHFWTLSELIDFRRISVEYTELLFKRYKMKCVDRLLLKKDIIDFLDSLTGDDRSALSISSDSLTSSKSLIMLHVFVHYHEKHSSSKLKTFSISKHHPE